MTVNLDSVLLGKEAQGDDSAGKAESAAQRDLTCCKVHRPDFSPFLMKAIGPRRGWNRVPNSMGGKGVFWMSTNTPALRDQCDPHENASQIRPPSGARTRPFGDGPPSFLIPN